MLKHAIKNKGQTINFISNSYALFNLKNFFSDNDAQRNNKTGDVKNYAVQNPQAKSNIAPKMIANILLIKSYTQFFEVPSGSSDLHKNTGFKIRVARR